jgi:hypothetical protein
MSQSSKYDEEKGAKLSAVESPHIHDDYGEVIIANRPKFFTKLNHILSRLGGEERGIERVLPEEKTDQVLPATPTPHQILTGVASIRQFLRLDECKSDCIHILFG